MNLKEYLRSKDCTLARAARLLKITRTHLSTIALGKKNPSWHLAKAIEDFTEGNIKAESLLKPRSKHVD